MTAGKNDQGGGNLIERAFYEIMGDRNGPRSSVNCHRGPNRTALDDRGCG